MKQEDIFYLEKVYLATKRVTLLHQWINALSKMDNSEVMRITEKAKTTTLVDTVVKLNIKVNPNLKLKRLYCLGLVRREVNYQKNNALSQFYSADYAY